jgi:hypothetical protein
MTCSNELDNIWYGFWGLGLNPTSTNWVGWLGLELELARLLLNLGLWTWLSFPNPNLNTNPASWNQLSLSELKTRNNTLCISKRDGEEGRKNEKTIWWNFIDVGYLYCSRIVNMNIIKKHCAGLPEESQSSWPECFLSFSWLMRAFGVRRTFSALPWRESKY